MCWFGSRYSDTEDQRNRKLIPGMIEVASVVCRDCGGPSCRVRSGPETPQRWLVSALSTRMSSALTSLGCFLTCPQGTPFPDLLPFFFLSQGSHLLTGREDGFKSQDLSHRCTADHSGRDCPVCACLSFFLRKVSISAIINCEIHSDNRCTCVLAKIPTGWKSSKNILAPGS